MKSTFKFLTLTLGCLLLASTGFAQWTLFTVEEGAVPNGTTYPTLTQAIATAETYLGGPHKIVILAGDYDDAGLTPDGTKIDEIYGDPTASVADIVFHGGSDFMALSSNMTISHMTVTGYDDAFNDGGVAITNTVINDVVMEGNDRGVELTGNSTNDVYVTNCLFYNQTGYGVVIGANAGCGPGIFVNDNCFVGNAVHAYENNLACGQDFDHNYWDDDVVGAATYSITAGGGGEVDNDPWRHMNVPDAPATGEFGEVVRVYFNWTEPGCAEVDEVTLAAYDFTANWNASKLAYVPGSFWPKNDGFLGPDDTQGGDAVYTFVDSDAGSGKLYFGGANFTSPVLGEGTLAYADFEVIAALTSVSIYTTSDYRDGDNNPIPVKDGVTVKDVIALQDNAPPVMDPIETLASNYPADKYSKNGQGPGPFVALFFSGMTCHDNWELASVQWSIDDVNWHPWFGTGAVIDHTDPGPREFDIEAPITGWNSPFEGPAWAYVRAVDAAGNPSASVRYDFEIDRSCATATLALADKGCAFFAGYTADETVAYTITGYDADVIDMQHRDAGYTGWTTETLKDAGDYLLDVTGNNHVHTVQFYLWDDVGNRSSVFSDQMRLDKIAPVPVGPVTINGGDAKTGDENVTVTIANHGGADAIMAILTEDAGDIDPCVPGNWFNKNDNAPTTTMPYVLDPVKDGPHTVHFAAADSAGNFATLAPDAITLDKTAPDNVTVLIEDVTLPDLGGEDCTDNYLVQVTVSWDPDDGDVVWIGLDHEGNVFWYDGGVLTSPQVLMYNMAHAGPGPASGTDVTINAQLWDNSMPANKGYGSDHIWLDFTPPPLTSAVMTDQDGATGPAGNAIHGQYSNDETVTLTLTGLTDDCEELWVSSDSWSSWQVFGVTGSPPADPYNLVYTYDGTPPLCGYSNIDVKSIDCAANESGVQSDGIIIDKVAPDITAFSGPTVSAGLLVTLSITATDDCSPNVPYYVRITEDGSSATPTWRTWASWLGDPTFDLEDKSPASNDGDRMLHLEVADRAGNVTETNALVKDGETVDDIVIEVDMTGPLSAGDVYMVSDNPLAMIDYTDNRSAGYNAFYFTPDPADGVTEIRIKNDDNSWNSNWVSAVPPIDLGVLMPGGDGDKNIHYRYRDAVYNPSVWFTHVVNFNNDPAPIPTNASATVGNSITLGWDDMCCQLYHIRSNFAGGYPQYANVVALGPPPHPATFGEGIFVAETPANSYPYAGPQPDLYAISIWSLSNNGVWSSGPNVEILANNYAKGDVSDGQGAMGPDGCLDFDPEFVFLAASYLTTTGDGSPPFDPYMDFAPTFDGTPDGYSLPDGAVDFEDLIIFALNYRDHRCAAKSAAGNRVTPGSVASNLMITAEMPSYSKTGEEFTVPISISDGAAIAGYHMVFGYDQAVMELVSVRPGEVYDNQDRSFFYHDVQAEGIDISSVVLSGAGLEAGEIALVTFRTTTSGQVTIEDELLDIRDWENQRAEATFDITAKSGALPEVFELSQNYPNPFNPTTTIELALPEATGYRLAIYNVIGQVVDVFEGHAEAGYVTFNWDASEQASGVYLYRVTAGSFTATRKMVLLK